MVIEVRAITVRPFSLAYSAISMGENSFSRIGNNDDKLTGLQSMIAIVAGRQSDRIPVGFR